MQVYLVDGTYELFRHYFALPSYKTEEGLEVGAVRGVLRSMLSLLENGATHLGVATDHVIESFRNDLWPGYKTSTGVPPDLLSQFPMLEDTLSALGISVWPMDEYEADDALASAAAEAAAYADQVVICTPDKDLAQCVVDCHVVQLDRRSGKIFNEDAVVAKFGVLPTSIPDYLALVGDSADGFPGLPAGARNPQLPCWPSIVTLERYHVISGSGKLRFGGPQPSLGLWWHIATSRCYSKTSPPSGRW